MSLDDLGRIAAGGVSVIAALAAAVYTAAKVLRSDKTYTQLIATLEEDRDYLRGQLEQERQNSTAMEQRFNKRLAEQALDGQNARADLTRQIEELRRQLHARLLGGDERG